MKKRGQPEAQIQRAIVQYLGIFEKQGKLFFFAVPNQGGRGLEKRGAILKGLGVKPGVSDLIIVWRTPAQFPMVSFIEIKSAKGVLSFEQKCFAASCSRFGFCHYIVSSLDDMILRLKSWRIVK